MTIHAYTENTPAPAYVNLSATGPCTVKLTVRSRGKDGVTGKTSAIDLTNEQLQDLAMAALTYLKKTQA